MNALLTPIFWLPFLTKTILFYIWHIQHPCRNCLFSNNVPPLSPPYYIALFSTLNPFFIPSLSQNISCMSHQVVQWKKRTPLLSNLHSRACRLVFGGLAVSTGPGLPPEPSLISFTTLPAVQSFHSFQYPFTTKTTNKCIRNRIRELSSSPRLITSIFSFFNYSLIKVHKEKLYKKWITLHPAWTPTKSVSSLQSETFSKSNTSQMPQPPPWHISNIYKTNVSPSMEDFIWSIQSTTRNHTKAFMVVPSKTIQLLLPSPGTF